MRHLYPTFRLIIVVILTLLHQFGYAHNGAKANVNPVEGIEVDGDLSDWPADFVKYPLEQYLWGFTPEKEGDIAATLMIGYNLKDQSIYVGVEVTDEEHVEDREDPVFYNHDQHVLYIDKTHAIGGAGVLALEVNRYINIMVHQEDNWDPLVKNASWDDIEVEISREATTTIYEWRIDMEGYLIPGKVIGFDYIVFDKDQDDGSSQVAWGYGDGIRHQCSGCLGDAYLVPENDKTGAITAQVELDGLDEYPQSLLAQSTSGDFYTHLAIDTTGMVKGELPVGEYELSVPEGLIETENEEGDDVAFRYSSEHKRIVSVMLDKSSDAGTLTLTKNPQPSFPKTDGIIANFSETRQAELAKIISEYQAYYGIPGVSLGLLKDGELIYKETYGVINAISNAPVEDNHLFEAASITKPVFTYLVMKLVEQEILDLDKPLYEYLTFPALEEYPEYKQMTARHVIIHRTGLPNWGQEMIAKPGEKFGYSGEGFEYLKRVVQEITGEEVEKLLAREMIDPLNINNMVFSESEFLKANVTTGHWNGVPSVQPLPDSPGMAWSMHTEAAGFSRFASALYNKEGLSGSTYEAMFTIQTPLPEEDWDLEGYEEGVGLGIFIRDSPKGRIFGHGGNNGDFKCEWEMFEESGDGYIIFTNADSGDYLNFDLAKYVLGEME